MKIRSRSPHRVPRIPCRRIACGGHTSGTRRDAVTAQEHQRVLVVDDEVPLTGVISGYLRREGFDVVVAHSGPDAVERARSEQPVLIVLDVMLPGFDGIEACRRIRQFSDAYIIMLTARDEEMDKVLGLSMGADDYLAKPFSPRELIARVRAMLRRPRIQTLDAASVHYTHGALRLDPEGRTVHLGDTEIALTRTEFDLLAMLMEHPRAVLSRRQLLDGVWGSGWYGDEHVVDVHVGHLRDKLDDNASAPTFIRTVRGVGYGMVTS